MSKVQFSVAVGDMRNKAGGAVFTKNRAGSIVRRKVSPVQPRSPSQMGVRASFTFLSKSWAGTLTDSQRAGWIALAAANPRKDVFGNNITLTGLQLYQACNRALATIGQAYISDPPASLSAEATGSLTIVATSSPAALTVLPASFNTSASGWVIFATKQMNAGRAFFESSLRIVKTGTTVLAAAQAILTEYTAKFGALISGRRVGIGMLYITKATGAMGLKVTGSQLVT